MTETMLPESRAAVTSEGEGPPIGQLVARYVALLKKYFWIALITFASVITYIVFTVMITDWRIKFRR